jgi:hypothetical protein
MPLAQVTLPDDGGDEFECVAQFHGYSGNTSISPQSGETKLQVVVPLSSKYDALPVTDRGGASLYFVVFARKRVDHYGTESDDGADELVADAIYDDIFGDGEPVDAPVRSLEELWEGT